MGWNTRKTVLLLAGAGLAAAAVHWLPDLIGAGVTSQLDTSAVGSDRILASLGVAYLGGVLTSLTPCVYPLIPITVSIFGARQTKSRLRGFALVTCYVLGMAAMFSGLGFAAASSGKAFGTILSNQWVLVGLALFFMAMAASMFGAFEIAVPQSLALKLNQVGGAGFGGALAMGLVAGIVAAPCTGPVLASLLAFVASSGSPMFGVVLLFTYALGIGLPFFLIGAFSVSLPKSGPWMEGVKSVFGVALLAMALTYLRDAVPDAKTLLAPAGPYVALGAALVGAGVLLGGVHRTYHGSAGEIGLKTSGVALAVVGIFLRVSLPSAASATSGAEVRWVTDHDTALASARALGKPVMIDLYADWCAACKELDRYTYVDRAVAAESERFVNVKIDCTLEDDKIEALYKRYGIQGLPTVVFYDSGGQPLPEPRVTGFVEAPKFLELMRKVR